MEKRKKSVLLVLAELTTQQFTCVALDDGDDGLLGLNSHWLPVGLIWYAIFYIDLRTSSTATYPSLFKLSGEVLAGNSDFPATNRR